MVCSWPLERKIFNALFFCSVSRHVLSPKCVNPYETCKSVGSKLNIRVIVVLSECTNLSFLLSYTQAQTANTHWDTHTPDLLYCCDVVFDSNEQCRVRSGWPFAFKNDLSTPRVSGSVFPFPHHSLKIAVVIIHVSLRGDSQPCKGFITATTLFRFIRSHRITSPLIAMHFFTFSSLSSVLFFLFWFGSWN